MLCCILCTVFADIKKQHCYNAVQINLKITACSKPFQHHPTLYQFPENMRGDKTIQYVYSAGGQYFSRNLIARSALACVSGSSSAPNILPKLYPDPDKTLYTIFVLLLSFRTRFTANLAKRSKNIFFLTVIGKNGFCSTLTYTNSPQFFTIFPKISHVPQFQHSGGPSGKIGPWLFFGVSHHPDPPPPPSRHGPVFVLQEGRRTKMGYG